MGYTGEVALLTPCLNSGPDNRLVCLNHRYLNGFGPLQIGGVENTLNDANINFKGFEGCIRDVYDNHKMYDLLNPLLEKNTELGCKLDNNACPDCNDHGYCEPLWTNSICVCDLGYTGPNCNSSKRCSNCYTAF